MAEFRIVGLQIPTRPLKPGRAPYREYHPEGLQRVDRLLVSPRGNHGVIKVGDTVVLLGI